MLTIEPFFGEPPISTTYLLVLMGASELPL
jgi:hypothetical protein